MNQPAPREVPDHDPAGVPVLGLLALGCVLVPWFVRAMSAHATLPYWDLDPMVVPPSMVGLGPAGSMLVDAVVGLGAALALWQAQRSSRAAGTHSWLTWAPPALAMVLVLIGIRSIAYHGWQRDAAYIQHQRVGAAWGAAMLGGLALWHLAADARLRAVGLAAIMGFVVLLAVKGAAQMLIEHPAMVAEFERGKDRLFAANGWTPESPMARGYTRRLMQNEATGWFGLSNVYASCAAAGALAWAAAAWSIAKQPASTVPRWMKFGALAGVIAAPAALAMSQSKGGLGALLVGLAAWGAWWLLSRARWHWSLAAIVAPTLVALTLLGVVARGLIGERSGELSILFRWFYMQAAVRIATGFELPAGENGPAVRVGNIWRGIGPDGFKDAYLIAKNPLSPEEVASPHSIFLDWWACLGAPGLAWGAVLVAALVLVGVHAGKGTPAGRSAKHGRESPSIDTPPLGRPLIRAVCGIGASSVLAALLAARGAIDETAALVAVGGLVAWCAAGSAALGPLLAGGIVMRCGVASMAAAIAAHAQIEVTASHPTSCGLFAAIIALAAAPGHPAPAGGQPAMPPARPSRGWWLVGGGRRAIVEVLVLLLVWGGVLPAWRWERTLRETAIDLQPVAEARRRLEEAAGLGLTEQRKAITTLASDLQARLGQPVEPSGQGAERAIRSLELATTAPVLERLRSTVTPFDWRVLREAGRQALRNVPGSTPGSPWTDLALVWPSTGIQLPPRDDEPGLASMHYWNAVVWDAHWRQTNSLDRSDVSLLRASLRLDPYNILTWMRLADIAAEAGRPEESKAAARRVLELDRLLRLDPLKQLDDRQRTRMERLAK